MTVELQVVQEAPAANKRLLAVLRDLLRQARSGELQSIAVAYMDGEGEVRLEYEIEEGHELTMASAARQLDENLRAEQFCGGED